MAEWIEIWLDRQKAMKDESPLAMAEWIEIYWHSGEKEPPVVSASDGGVDWNPCLLDFIGQGFGLR